MNELLQSARACDGVKTPPPAYDLLSPVKATAPVIFASPHSGDYYPPEFVARALPDPVSLRGSEDAFVDRLFANAPGFGAPLLRGRYARAYLDLNREAYELDPVMFDEELPEHVNRSSPRVLSGLGTVPRVVSRGQEIYDDKISFREAEDRLRQIYFPYHRALGNLIRQTRYDHGGCLLLDCHSMPTRPGPGNGRMSCDIVLGDRYGKSCSPAVSDLACDSLKAAGFDVVRNTPYAGGYTTVQYGRPENGVHTLQIEINRGLYMNEATIEPLPQFEAVARALEIFMLTLCDMDPAILAPQP